VDSSPAAARRRGLAAFHVVFVLMAGGLGALWPGPWVILAAVVWLIGVSRAARRQAPAMMETLTRIESELIRLQATFEHSPSDASEPAASPASTRPGASRDTTGG